MSKIILTYEEFMAIIHTNMPGNSSFKYINPRFLIEAYEGPKEIAEIPTHLEFEIED